MENLDQGLVHSQPPFSLEAEQALLGAVILSGEKFADIAEKIKSDDFYVPQHKAIYKAMQSVFLQSKSIDLVTIIEALVETGEYTDESARSYIKNLGDAVPSLSNIEDYAKIIRDKATLRRLIEVASEITESAYAQTDDVQQIIDAAESKIFSLAQGNITNDFVHIRDVILETYNYLTMMKNDPELAKGTPSYFSRLDSVLGGMGAGDLVIVGARPGMGKTSFAVNIAIEIAKRKGCAVAIFSLEMSKTQVASRMLSSEALIDSYKFRNGRFDDVENGWERLCAAATALSGAEIYIDDTTGISVSGMKAKLRRLNNLGFVVIDYLQLMQADRKIENRALEIGEISRGLKLLAKELGVPVMTCAQLSRATDRSKTQKPMLSDLRDSGAIEQDADVVMFIYREDYYDKEKSAEQNTVDIIVAKNRHGSTGEVTLGWQAPYTKFLDIDINHE
ncbi:MAG: replicative DNA helicase [Ruminococcaceae bacterium]|nr:replicative DNA helicase [Oscillospiraceae bacterium]